MRTGELGFWWRSLGGPPRRRARRSPGPTRGRRRDRRSGLHGPVDRLLPQARPALAASRGARGRAGRLRRLGPQRRLALGVLLGPAARLRRRRRTRRATRRCSGRCSTPSRRSGGVARRARDRRRSRPRAATSPSRSTAPSWRACARRSRAAAATGVGEAGSARAGRGRAGANGCAWRARSARAFSPHVARRAPGQAAASGLAAAVEGLGVEIYERTPVQRDRARARRARRGERSRARWVVRATEGYTASLRGLRRALVPMNSSMIITEPLARRAPGSEIGWAGAETLGDGAHVYAYLQRTADGRIAIGGRGVPYRYGSRTDGRGRHGAGDGRAACEAKLRAMFPAAARRRDRPRLVGRAGRAARLVPVGAAPTRPRGLAWAGGYVGEGVAAANLAGRTLRDLLLGRAQRAHRAAVGRPPAAALGARAAALGGDPRRLRALPPGRRAPSGAAGARRGWARSSTRCPAGSEAPPRGDWCGRQRIASPPSTSRRPRCPTRRCSTRPTARSRRSR